MNALFSRIMTFIDRRLNRRYIQAICLIVLLTFLIALAASFITQENKRTIFGSYLGADFAAFYVAGSIYNSYSPERIYDRELHTRLYRELFPDMPPHYELLYYNAPFFVLPFPLLAHLSYPWAYFLWVLISVGFYISGFSLTWKQLTSMPKRAKLTALLLSLSFTPFLIECLAGGQTSAFGFFFLALALGLEQRGHRILSGVALSVLTYKPTLLLLIIPMLIFTRRFRTLLGFALGCAGLFLVSLLSVGWQGCLNYVGALFRYSDNSTGSLSGLRSWKFVDVNSFFRMLAGEHIYIRWAMTFAAAIAAFPLLIKAWFQSGTARGAMRNLIWATTITWTLVLNVYMGIYDTVFVVPAVLLASEVLYMKERNQNSLPSGFKYLLLLLYLVPMITQMFAQMTGIQLYTIVLAGFGIYLLDQLRAEKDCTRVPTATSSS